MLMIGIRQFFTLSMIIFTETKHIHLSRVNIKCTCERIMRENFPHNVAGFYTPALNLTCTEPEIINFSVREFLFNGIFSKYAIP